VHQFGTPATMAKYAPTIAAADSGVHHTALEDQVNVHQPVAEDGVAKRQRQYTSDNPDNFMAGVGTRRKGRAPRK